MLPCGSIVISSRVENFAALLDKLFSCWPVDWMELNRASVLVFAAAGPVHDGRIEMTNAEFAVEEEQCRNFFPDARIYLMNDFEAQAWACLSPVFQEAELLLPGSDLAPVREVYDACAKNWNLSFMEPHFLPKGEWMKNKRYLYLWRDENGTPAGAMAFTKADGVMDCRMEFGKENFLLFRDVRALTALLRFAKGFAADYRAIRFAVPQNVRVQSLIAEGNHAACEAYYNCMARLVNVPRALELCRTSAGGSLTIAVTDEILPENGRTWRVDFNPDGPNAVTGTEAAPDIELSVSDLTQLLIGACTAADLPMMPGCTVRNPSAPFDKIFIPKASHILDLF